MSETKPHKYKGEYVRDENGHKLKRLNIPKISAIPNSYEKSMSFIIGDIQFVDSLKFMASSLDKLAVNLYGNAHEREHDLRRDPDDKFKNFNFMKKKNSPNTMNYYVKKDTILTNGWMIYVN